MALKALNDLALFHVPQSDDTVIRTRSENAAHRDATKDCELLPHGSRGFWVSDLSSAVPEPNGPVIGG